jgi:hypothetical protein
MVVLGCKRDGAVIALLIRIERCVGKEAGFNRNMAVHFMGLDKRCPWQKGYDKKNKMKSVFHFFIFQFSVLNSEF